MFHLLVLLLMKVSNSRTLSSATNRCSCVSSLTCTTVPYGRLALDIALLGVHAPCPLPAQVLCCDRSGLEELYGDSEPRYRILEQGHLVGNGDIFVHPLPELDIADEVDVVDNATIEPESFENDKLKIEESDLAGGGDINSSKCGCIPSGICPQQFKYIGNDQCDVTAGLEFCCVDVVEEGEPQREVQVEDNINPGEPQYLAPAVELSEKQSSPISPPQLSLVPCTNTCTGILYSPLDTKHRQVYGVLADCASGLVRCIYHLDMQQFIHPDNFNLPVFNFSNFLKILSKWSGDNKSLGLKFEDGVNGDNKIVNTPNREGDEISVKDHQGKAESVLAEKQVLKDSEMSRLKRLHRRFFTSSKVKNKVDDLVVYRNEAKKLPENLFASKTSVLGSEKQTSKLASFASQNVLTEIKRNDLTEKIIQRMAENLAKNKNHKSDKLHMPEPKDITGVEIIIPRPSSQSSRVMLHMDKAMMEMKVDEDRLLSVLQAVLIALE